ncbi:MAG TPA: hypothetical protein VGJ20_07275 [Xanthobacteraceae bacterium]
MSKFRNAFVPVTAFTVLALSAHANAQTPAKSPVATTTTLGNTITVPGVYESTISTIGALATSATAALKTNRSDARTLAIRKALTTALLAPGPIKTISLGKSGDTSQSIGETAILCAPRQNYISNAVYLNYLNTLAQNIDTVSAKAPAPTDIPSAVKLLFASSSYAITDKVAIENVTDLGDKALANCEADLSAYENAYYGTAIRPALATEAVEATAAAPGSGTSVSTFAFLGPIGGAIDTFLSILQPVLITASEAVDEVRRQKAIQTALDSPDTQAKIQKTGQQLAAAVDSYSVALRYKAAGSFVEQLISIREMPIDLSNVEDCQHVDLAPASRLPSNAPNEAFIGCYSAAWSKLKSQVDNLNTLADNYDALADANTVTARALFTNIMNNFNKLKNGAPSDSFLSDITEFISFANAVATAASKSNIATLKSAIAAAEK